MPTRMKTRKLIGRRIVEIRQVLVDLNEGQRGSEWCLDAIVLDDGTELSVNTLETESDYQHRLVIR